MKQAAKTWLVIAAALVLIGIVIFVCAMTANRWDLSLFGGADYETNTISIKESFESISIEGDKEDVVLLPSDDGKCKVVFYERDRERHTASVGNGTLSIELIDERKWYDYLALFSFSSPTITVYLPEDGYASLSVGESTGDIEIPADFAFESIDVSVSTGDVDCRASASGAIRIGTSTGRIRLEDLDAGEVALSVSTGGVEVNSVACEGNVSIAVSTGRTRLTDISCRSVDSDGSTGDIAMENVIASDAITVERSTGNVKLEKCDAAELTVTTDTGDVTGTLLSEKVFIARSDTGRVDVPETSGGGMCRITTDTGDIKIAVG